MTLKDAIDEMNRLTRVSGGGLNKAVTALFVRTLGSIVFKRALATPTVAYETRLQVMDKLGDHYDDLVNVSTVWYMRTLANGSSDSRIYEQVAVAMCLDYDKDEPMPSREALTLILKTNPMYVAWYILSLSTYGVDDAPKGTNRH